MPTVTQALRLHDGFTPVLKNIQQSMNLTINAFERMNQKTKDPIVTTQLNLAKNKIEDIGAHIKSAEEKQEKFNQKVKDGGNAYNGILGKLKTLITGYALLKGAQAVDSYVQTDARLKLVNDGLQTQAELQEKIYQASQRSRANYNDMASSVAKLNLLARDNFKSNDEAIIFTELMQKSFAISGASQTEQQSGMYQLTQAMAAGKLQGDEFRSIMENAPMLAEAIATYTGKTKGELKELSSEGKITADVIKNSLFSASEDINEKFETMPKTFSSVWTQFKNDAVRAFAPVMQKINDLVNTEGFANFINNATTFMYIFADAIALVIDGCIWLSNVLSPLEPILFGIGIGVLALVAMWGAYNIAVGIATIKQNMLNSAFWTCPVVWVAAIIIALIAVLAYLWFTNDEVAKGMLFAWDSFLIGLDMFALGFKGLWFGLLDFLGYFKIGALAIIDGFINSAVLLINGFIEMLNLIPGVAIDTISWRSTLATDAATEFAKEKAERDAELADDAQAIYEKAAEMNATRDDRVANRNNWIDDMKGGIDNLLGGDSLLGNIGTVENVNSINDTVDISSEDIKLLRELAEKKFVQNNISNQPIVNVNVENINENAEADFIIDKVTTAIYESTEESLEGVPVG